MTIRFSLLLILLGLLGGPVALNWTEFTAPTTLTVGFGVLQAPLGLYLQAAEPGPLEDRLDHLLPPPGFEPNT